MGGEEFVRPFDWTVLAVAIKVLHEFVDGSPASASSADTAVSISSVTNGVLAASVSLPAGLGQ